MIVIQTTKLTQQITKLLKDKKASDILTLDVSKQCSFADVFVIASGDSQRQVRAISDGLIEQVGKPHAVEGESVGEWIVLDYGDVVVHLFHTPVRSRYCLEELWSGDSATQAAEDHITAEEEQQQL